jgi:hypothetical protein
VNTGPLKLAAVLLVAAVFSGLATSGVLPMSREIGWAVTVSAYIGVHLLLLWQIGICFGRLGK